MEERFSRMTRTPSNRRRVGTASSKDFWISVLLTQAVVCVVFLCGCAGIRWLVPAWYTPAREAVNQFVYQQPSIQLQDVSLPQVQEFVDGAKEKLEQVFGEARLVFKPIQNQTDQDSQTGQGGLWEVFDKNKSEEGPLTPPDGATLSPVFTTANFILPVKGTVTSAFGYRTHPITGKLDFHSGVDLAAPLGTEISAALDGTVCEVGTSDIYGNYVILEHSQHLKTFYGHCTEIIAKEGMKIRQGRRIAVVGSTGMSTGPHCHFSVLVDGLYTDPAWVLKELKE